MTDYWLIKNELLLWTDNFWLVCQSRDCLPGVPVQLVGRASVAQLIQLPPSTFSVWATM
jgi:hypothetical protein